MGVKAPSQLGIELCKNNYLNFLINIWKKNISKLIFRFCNFNVLTVALSHFIKDYEDHKGEFFATKRIVEETSECSTDNSSTVKP